MMELLVKHLKLKPKYEYAVYECNELIYRGYADKPGFISFNKISIYDTGGKEIYSIQQENYTKLILRLVPFICFFKFSVNPFNYYYNHSKVGYLKEEYNGGNTIIGEINNKLYKLIEQNEKYIHIFSEENQVGLIERHISHVGELDEYKILFNSSLKKDIATSFCIIINLLLHDPSNQDFPSNSEIRRNLSRRKFNENWKPEH